MPSVKDLSNKPSKVPSSRRYPHFYNLQKCLKNALESSPKILAKRLGYASEKKCAAAVQRLLAFDEPYEWLDAGHYDYTHTSLSLLQKCAQLVGEGFLGEIKAAQDDAAKLREFRAEVERAKAEAQRLADLHYLEIRIQTDFRRREQPIHILALCAGMLYFRPKLKEEWLQNGVECVLGDLPQILREHYEANKGCLGYPYTSRIVGYTVFWRNGDEKRVFYFDTQGNEISAPSERDTNPRAYLKW